MYESAFSHGLPTDAVCRRRFPPFPPRHRICTDAIATRPEAWWVGFGGRVVVAIWVQLADIVRTELAHDLAETTPRAELQNVARGSVWPTLGATVRSRVTSGHRSCVAG